VDTSLAWLYELQENYRRTGRALWSMSDWHNDLNDLVLPVSLLANVSVDPALLMRYRFVDSVIEIKSLISSFYNEFFDIHFDPRNLAFCQNGTSALNLMLRALSEMGIRRALIVTPAYFSIFNVAKLYGISIVYQHMDLLNDLSIDPAQIVATARDQMADLIILTNPIFSTGKGLSAEHVRLIVRAVADQGIWMFLDETLAGLPWEPNSQRPFATPNMQEAIHSPRFIYLWSVSKSLFLNGAKHALVLAPHEIIQKMERDADLVVGGLTAHQIAVAEQTYLKDSLEEIAQCCGQNIARFTDAYDLCSAGLEGTLLQLSQVDSGFHGIAFTSISSANPVGCAREVSAAMIERHGISTIPIAHFGFPDFSPIGFRVNFSKNPGKLQHALVRLAEIFHENPHFSD
jgi:aspartate/methionine/tyrosine aminotransferase